MMPSFWQRLWPATRRGNNSRPGPRLLPKATASLLLTLCLGLTGWTGAFAQPVITLTAPRLITTNSATQLDPAISGDTVVYTDLRNGNEDVYYYDLSSGTETRITSTSPNQRLNDVSGSRIVYTDLGPPGAHIVLYDVVTRVTSPLTSGPTDQNPRIDGDIVVFERGISGSLDVIAYDLGSDLETLVATTTTANELNPVVSGRRVVYERQSGSTAHIEIVVFDLDTKNETVLGDSALFADPQDSWRPRPDIDGDLVVWAFLTAAGDRDIAIHHLSTGITAVLTMAGNQGWAHVSGRVVVFDDDSSGTPAVWMYHVDSAQLIRIAEGTATQFLNDISGNRIVYTTNESGNFDIALVEFEILTVDPATGLEFGSVNAGSSQVQIVTLSHVGGDLLVSGLSLDPHGSAGFSIGMSAPQTVARGDSLDIPVTFAPLSPGAASNTLRITTDAGTVDVPLSGTGVSVTPPPQQEIADILAFFDASVTAGTLVGSGNGNSAPGRRNALRNMIEAAGDLIQQGRIEDACQQLADALDRTDGNPTPPDFVAGTAASELAQRIRDLRSALGCSS